MRTDHGGPPAPALRLSGLRFHAGGAAILNGIDLDVPDGDFLGIIGPNGAGKTTLLNMISGLLAPSSGTIRLGGREITGLDPAARAQAGLGRTFQTSLLFGALPVAENVRLAAQAQRNPGMRWLAGWRHPRPGDPDHDLASRALDAVGLAGLAGQPASALSHGDKRKLELAMLLAGQARVLLLDEPMAGVNSRDVPGLTALIKDLHADGRTVLMVEHHMAVVLGLARRVAVLDHGELLACGDPDAVMADQAVQHAYLGESA